MPLLAAAAGVVDVRWIDVEAFSAACSDVVIAETPRPGAWYDLVERLRDTPLFSVPYFRVEQILTGIEDGYRDHAAATLTTPPERS